MAQIQPQLLRNCKLSASYASFELKLPRLNDGDEAMAV
jgi:hypothetical protein